MQIMNLQLAYRSYRREFAQPFRTAHGIWEEREGFILRLESDHGVRYGEVAPIPGFGSETVEDAAAFLEAVVKYPDLAVPDALPCCGFALSAAICGREAGLPGMRDYRLAGLLPAGSDALRVAWAKLDAGYFSFKWKIGLGSPSEEIEICDDLLDVLGPDAKLRLDANGGLDPRGLELWLDYLLPHAGQIDYLEQPLPPGQENLMRKLSVASGIPVALDESLNLSNRERWLTPGEWDGPLVIKPLLMGDITGQVERLRPLAPQLVISSVFETGIGLSNALALADALPEMKYAIGFDTLSAFDDALSGISSKPTITADVRAQIDMEAIWNQLSQ